MTCMGCGYSAVMSLTSQYLSACEALIEWECGSFTPFCQHNKHLEQSCHFWTDAWQLTATALSRSRTCYWQRKHAFDMKQSAWLLVCCEAQFTPGNTSCFYSCGDLVNPITFSKYCKEGQLAQWCAVSTLSVLAAVSRVCCSSRGRWSGCGRGYGSGYRNQPVCFLQLWLSQVSHGQAPWGMPCLTLTYDGGVQWSTAQICVALTGSSPQLALRWWW